MENNFIENYFDEVKGAFSSITSEKINVLVNKINEVKEKEGTVFIIGNGGSASTASHMACDLIKNIIKDHNSQETRLRVTSLTDNVATISAYGNDFSYDDIFSQQLKSLVGDNDLLIAISASGNSKNILKAIDVAREKGIFIFGLFGNNGGIAAQKCDDSIIIPSKNYGVIEDLHLMIGHLIVVGLSGDNLIS